MTQQQNNATSGNSNTDTNTTLKPDENRLYNLLFAGKITLQEYLLRLRNREQ